MKQYHRLISLILTFLMLVSVFTAIPFTAYGADTTSANDEIIEDEEDTSDIIDDSDNDYDDTSDIIDDSDNDDEDASDITNDSDNDYDENQNDDDDYNSEDLVDDYILVFGDYECEIYDDNTIEISSYDGEEETIEIPDSIAGYPVTSIGEFAFEGRDTATSITIPDSVTYIGDGAFIYCENLKSIKIPENVTYIGEGAFSGCTNLKSVTIPDSVTDIGDEAFVDCPNLKSVTIPATVENIGSYALGYYYDDDGDFQKVNNFSIRSYPSTVAEKYATNNGLTFINVNKSTSLTLSKSSGSVYISGKISIKATVKNGYGKTTYKSSNTKVAKVDNAGKVTGIKEGTASITVKNNGVSKVFKITVKKPTLNSKNKTLKVGKTFNLTVKGKVGKAVYTSSKSKVAVVNSKGKVTAKSRGNATITVKTNGIKLKCKIKVK